MVKKYFSPSFLRIPSTDKFIFRNHARYKMSNQVFTNRFVFHRKLGIWHTGKINMIPKRYYHYVIYKNIQCIIALIDKTFVSNIIE